MNDFDQRPYRQNGIWHDPAIDLLEAMYDMHFRLMRERQAAGLPVCASATKAEHFFQSLCGTSVCVSCGAEGE